MSESPNSDAEDSADADSRKQHDSREHRMRRLVQAEYSNGDRTVVEKFLAVTEEWTRTSEKVKDEAVANFKDTRKVWAWFGFC